MQTKSNAEFKLATGHENLGKHWATLVEQHSTSETVLALYLIRRSLDYFLECAGYIWDESTQLYNYNPTIAYSMNKLLVENKSKYIKKAPPIMTDLLCESARKSVVIAELSGKTKPYQFDLGFNVGHLLNLAKCILALNRQIKENHRDKDMQHRVEFWVALKDWVLPKDLFYDETWQRFMVNVESDRTTNPNMLALDRWKKSIKLLADVIGNEPTEYLPYYSDAYQSHQRKTKVYEHQFRELCTTHDIDTMVVAQTVGVDLEQV